MAYCVVVRKHRAPARQRAQTSAKASWKCKAAVSIGICAIGEIELTHEHVFPEARVVQRVARRIQPQRRVVRRVGVQDILKRSSQVWEQAGAFEARRAGPGPGACDRRRALARVLAVDERAQECGVDCWGVRIVDGGLLEEGGDVARGGDGDGRVDDGRERRVDELRRSASTVLARIAEVKVRRTLSRNVAQ